MSLQPDAIPFDFGPPPPTFGDPLEERMFIKERLACAYRVFAKLGLCEGASGHLTVRDPVRKDCFWVTPYGKQFALMTASDLLLIDHAGKIVMGGKPDRQFYNSAAFVIHAAIHAARPLANAVCHSHSPHGKAWAVMRKPLPIYTQDACVFFNDCALYDSFGGVVLDASESAKITEALEDKKAAILSAHGLLTVGESIERWADSIFTACTADRVRYVNKSLLTLRYSATAWFITLENECRVALLVDAAAAGDPTNKPRQIDAAAAQFTYDASGFERAGWFEALPWFELIEAETNGAYKE